MSNIILIFHITGGSIGILTGLSALFLPKGKALHRKIGNIFFGSMVLMAATGAYIALAPLAMTSFMAGALTFYMVITSWLTARNTRGTTGWPEHVGTLYITLLAIVGVWACWELAHDRGAVFGGGVDAGLDFFLYFYTGITMLALMLDLSVLYRGGIYGAQRIARHLWRMCFALWVATGSFFLGQPQVFPQPIRDMVILRILPFLLVTILLFFWLVRVYVIPRYKLKRTVP